MYSIQLRHPFGLLVSGGTKSGKTTFVKKLLTYVDIMIEKPSENITYYYSEFQNTFGEIQTLVPQIKFVQGLPDDILDTINPETRNLFIVDDDGRKRCSYCEAIYQEISPRKSERHIHCTKFVSS